MKRKFPVRNIENLGSQPTEFSSIPEITENAVSFVTGNFLKFKLEYTSNGKRPRCYLKILPWDYGLYG